MSKAPYVEQTKGDGIFKPNQVVVAQSEYPLIEANLLMRFVERWGLVAAIPDGEDSAGRQKLRLPTPEELVKRAADLAAETYAECQKRGWILDLPAPLSAEGAGEEKSQS